MYSKPPSKSILSNPLLLDLLQIESGMEIDLGLKITRDTDHPQSSTDFHIAKDRAGPVFVSTETDSVFILSAHLKGFEKENIKISINEDGKRMIISGEKLVSETTMSGWRLYKRDGEVKGFSRTFKIPDGVVLDNIRAKFGEDNCSLTIYMPKSEKGIRGHEIEEVKEEDEDRKQKPADENHGDEQLKKDENEMPPMKKSPQITEAQKPPETKSRDQEAKPGNQERENGEASKQHKEDEGAVVEKKSAIVAPSFLMGSALIASLVVLVVGWVRVNSTKKQ